MKKKGQTCQAMIFGQKKHVIQIKVPCKKYNKLPTLWKYWGQDTEIGISYLLFREFLLKKKTPKNTHREELLTNLKVPLKV